MAQGRVTVNNLNLNQGEFTSVEQTALFIGVALNNIGTVLSLTAQSDLDELLGEADSELKTNIQAAILNGGQNWFAYALPQNEGYDIFDAVNIAMEFGNDDDNNAGGVDPEFIVICTPATSNTEIENDSALAASVEAVYARRVIILRALPGIDATVQTWSDYEASQIAIAGSTRAIRVGLVPQLHGNNLGCYVGRLCNRAYSIADSPIKTANGPVIGLGPKPVDVTGRSLPDSTFTVLDLARITVNQRYIGYAGIYWSDGNLLDAEAGDFQIVEYLRPVDAAARRVRILAIGAIGNRTFNNSPASILFTESYFCRPLHEMSRSTTVNGVPFPGDIEPPSSDAIKVIWESRFKVTIYITVRPYGSPKDITTNFALDLRNFTN